MSQVKLTMNVLLSLIIHSKKRGSGVVGNGRLLVKLLQIFADNSIKDKNVLACFNDEIEKSKSYHKVDKFIGRFLPQGRYYPYDKIKFSKFESLIGIKDRMAEYLRITAKFCDEIFDESKIDSFVFTLLEILRHDESIDKILYGRDFIPKSDLFGTVAHPKRICIEALLLGCLYHVHKYPDESEEISIFEPSEKITFKTVRYDILNSLETDCPINILDNIKDVASRQKTAEMKYRVEIREQNGSESDSNIILFGSGGMGKTTYLLSLISDKSYINFYLPLYDFKPEYHENYCENSMWILMNILLKYRYQYEYQTYDSACASESEDVVLSQLSELENELKSATIGNKKVYRLLLDGINEISEGLLNTFCNEIKKICTEWENVQIIVTGRTVPNYEVFKDFTQYEICGIDEKEYAEILNKKGIKIKDSKLAEILKVPMFLDMYINSENNCETQGELIASYMNKYAEKSELYKFVINYVIPFSAKKSYGILFSEEITRSDLYQSYDDAVNFYLHDERIYQNYIAPQKLSRTTLMNSKNKEVFIDIILDKMGFFKVSEISHHRLKFANNYYREYFVAKHIVNILETIFYVYNENDTAEIERIFREQKLDRPWFSGNDRGVYKLIGDLTGDYKNNPKRADFCDLSYTDIFNHLLHIYAKFNADWDFLYITENILAIMEKSRDGIICNTRFDNLPLPANIPCNIKFNYNGMLPSSFRGCKVQRIGIYSGVNMSMNDISVKFPFLWYAHARYSSDKSKLALILDNGYVLLYDVANKKILWDSDLNLLTSDSINYGIAEFIDNDSKVVFAGNNMFCKSFEVIMDVSDGKIFNCRYTIFAISYDDSDKLSKKLIIEIASQLDHFKNCRFSRAVFCDEDYGMFVDI